MTRLVAVIDIGKTNKKVALVDEALGIVAARSASFPAQVDEDGILVEQVEAIWAWLCDQLAGLYRHHPFQAISVSTHGACWAGVDGDGALSVPVVAYEHDLGEDGQRRLDDEFYRRCGALERLQDETGTCDLPLLINPAKAVLFLQTRMPERWARTAAMLNYPQFWGFRLTGERAVEATYAANHSFLLDIRARRPSSAARALGVDHLVDTAFRDPWARLGTLTVGLQRRLGLPALPVTVGIHDSNAALLPYLIKHGDRDFVLDSTGTWCVAMHRVAEVRYRPDELGQKIIFNIDALGRITKTSFLMGGQDYQLHHDLIGGADPGFDAARIDAACTRVGDAVLPGAFPSQFPRRQGGLLADGELVPLSEVRAGRQPAWFADPALGHDLLNLSLALQSEVALRRTGIGERTAIFIEGGFRNNPTFLAVLAALFPTNPVFLTNLREATASGAALLGHALLAGCSPVDLAERIRIDETPVIRPTLPRLAAYRAAWLAQVT